MLVGLTGGIGSGKSAVTARLAHHGALVIDADLLAREVVAPGTDGLAEIVAAFGAGILDARGALDRPALARRVFGDDPARRALEAIIHPRVRARTDAIIAAAPPDVIVINDVPLLVEAGLADRYDIVLVVLASQETRVERLARQRGMTRREALDRIAAQATDDQRRAVADLIIINDGTLGDLHQQVDRLWREHLTPKAGSPG